MERNEELAKKLTVQYDKIKSISFGADEDYVYFYPARVNKNAEVCTAAQYDYLNGMSNIEWASNSTIRKASKSAASCMISVVKQYSDYRFYAKKR